ncbi:MAG TPA: hypothetical protein VKG43_01705, partial [Acidimicrobiales bacterium]|nr:hypothetical protein [Acidimicrobiales bacterium]
DLATKLSDADVEAKLSDVRDELSRRARQVNVDRLAGVGSEAVRRAPQVDADLFADLRTELLRWAKQIDELVEGATHVVEATLEPLEGQLPPVARDASSRARAQARDAHRRVRQALDAVN